MRETADNTSTETAYYLLSTALAPERFNEVMHQLWGVKIACSGGWIWS